MQTVEQIFLPHQSSGVGMKTDICNELICGNTLIVAHSRQKKHFEGIYQINSEKNYEIFEK